MFKWLEKIIINWIEKRLYTIDIEYVEMDGFYGLPIKMTPGSAGYDVYCIKDITLLPGQKMKIPFGMIMGFDGSKAVLVEETRSSLDCKLDIQTTTSILDGDYREQYHVVLRNKSNDVFESKRGDRIAQIVCYRTCKVNWIRRSKVIDLPRTDRTGGLGSTGR